MSNLNETLFNNILWLKATTFKDDKYKLDRVNNRIINRVSDNQHEAHIETNYYIVIKPTPTDDFIIKLIKKNKQEVEYNLPSLLEKKIKASCVRYVVKNYFFKLGYQLHTLDVFPNAPDAPKHTREEIITKADEDLDNFILRRRQDQE